MGLIKEIKAFESGLGFSETENFKTYSDEIEVYNYTFFTPKTTLPYSLDDPLLQRSAGTPESLGINPEDYDLFFYPIEALAEIQTPVTGSLLETPLHRFIYIIFHEDWHEQISTALGIEEPSGEVVGYHAAMLFTAEKFGADSATYKTLQAELNNKLKESQVYRQYYGELNHLYASLQSGQISEAETLSHKAALLKAMDSDIKDIWGGRRKQLNNAFIAFQMTYFRHLPFMQQVYTATNADLTKTISILSSVPTHGSELKNAPELKSIETETINYLQKFSQKP